jgi:hypothetical protein
MAANRDAFARAEAGEFTLALSAAIQEEVEEVLAEKFRWPPKRILWACQPLWAVARLAKPNVRLQVG